MCRIGDGSEGGLAVGLGVSIDGGELVGVALGAAGCPQPAAFTATGSTIHSNARIKAQIRTSDECLPRAIYSDDIG